jgi:hypothetical protein
MFPAYMNMVNPSEIAHNVYIGFVADGCRYVPTNSTFPILANTPVTKVAVATGSIGDGSHNTKDADIIRDANTAPVLRMSNMYRELTPLRD